MHTILSAVLPAGVKVTALCLPLPPPSSRRCDMKKVQRERWHSLAPISANFLGRVLLQVQFGAQRDASNCLSVSPLHACLTFSPKSCASALYEAKITFCYLHPWQNKFKEMIKYCVPSRIRVPYLTYTVVLILQRTHVCALDPWS